MDNKSYFFGKSNTRLKKFLTPYFSIFDINNLKEILINFSITNKEIYLDPKKTPCFIENFFKTIGIVVKYSQDPCVSLKLIKNSIEIKGSKSSHIRDGVSICKFLFWLKKNFRKKKITEISAQKKLERFRKMNKTYKFPSFSTISGTGPNSAIIHYKASIKSNRTLKKGDLY